MTSCASQFHAAPLQPPAAAAAREATGGVADMTRPNVTSDVSLTTHVSQWWATVPVVTASVIVVCVGVYVVDLLTGYDSFFQVCSSPDFFVSNFQLYRAFTSVVFHKGILHLGLNMMALYPIASPLERLMGSLRTAHAVLLFAATNGVIDTVLAYAVKLVAGYQGLVMECGIGFSGVIFSLIVIENQLSAGSTRSIFGMFSVPASWYPWVLLIFFQMLMPSASFMGHLSGILSGLAYKQGFFSTVTPTSPTFASIERLPFLSSAVRRPGFISGGHSVASMRTSNDYGLPTISVPGAASSFGSATNLGNSLASSWRSLQASFGQMRERLQQQQHSRPGGAYQQLPQHQQQQQHQGAAQAAFAGGDMSGRSLLQSPAGNVAPLPPGSFGIPMLPTHTMGQPPHTMGQAAAAGSSAAAGSGADPRFPGKGRTLAEQGASSIPESYSPAQAAQARTGQAAQAAQQARPPPPPAGAFNPAVAAAAAAALARASGRPTPVPAGAPEPPVTQSLPRQTGPAAAQAPSAQFNPGLEDLVAMGFARDAAESALVAANGDVAMAVDILSAS